MMTLSRCEVISAGLLNLMAHFVLERKNGTHLRLIEIYGTTSILENQYSLSVNSLLITKLQRILRTHNRKLSYLIDRALRLLDRLRLVAVVGLNLIATLLHASYDLLIYLPKHLSMILAFEKTRVTLCVRTHDLAYLKPQLHHLH